MDDIQNIRARNQRFETFRTPSYSYEPLFDYRPEWFDGAGFDPSAGDGRMLRALARRGHQGPYFLNDIRAEEMAAMREIGEATTGDYLAMRCPPRADFMVTNPPFTQAQAFVAKARSHISGPICILQSIAWQTTRKRSEWLRHSGLAFVLNLSRRPKWELDGGDQPRTNIWDFAWFVFLPAHSSLPSMDWLP